MFQKHEILGPHIWQSIPGPVELSYTRYRSKMYDRIFKKNMFLNFAHVFATPKFLENRQNGQ